MANELKVYKLNDYEWYITPWNITDTLKWYNEEFEDNIIKEDIIESNLNTEGMWWETEDKNDIERLGDYDEIIGIEKTLEGTKRKICFGNLMRKEGEIYKYIPFREVIKHYYLNSILTEPEVIATTEW
ncbi:MULTISPECIES: hypothetical protein [unclassified Clostridium]|uniref:hypothetical protein n=1 Tax=unclassified Clostridium TaxID=2614128 RepID=UPI00207AAA66|nr:MULTISPECIES: hypothetical protein [unclassified Clostridium]